MARFPQRARKLLARVCFRFVFTGDPEEAERSKVLGLGPNLFYNSPMEACIVICRASKPKARKGKILFINAVNEVTGERAQSFLTDNHIKRIASAYREFRDEPGFTRTASIAETRARNHSLAIPLYVEPLSRNCDAETNGSTSVSNALTASLESRQQAGVALARVLPGVSRPDAAMRMKAASSCVLLKDRAKWKRVRFGEVVENVIRYNVSGPTPVTLPTFLGGVNLRPNLLGDPMAPEGVRSIDNYFNRAIS